jgi:hypothetical protein
MFNQLANLGLSSRGGLQGFAGRISQGVSPMILRRRRRRRLPLESRAEHSSVSAAEPQVLVQVLVVM